MIGVELLLIVLGLVLVQIFAINILWQRVATVLERTVDRPPFTTFVTIHSLGPQPHSVCQLLDRATRLDLAEIDTLIEAGCGRLPIPMSRSAAQRLSQDLRALGAIVALCEARTATAGAHYVAK